MSKPQTKLQTKPPNSRTKAIKNATNVACKAL